MKILARIHRRLLDLKMMTAANKEENNIPEEVEPEEKT